MSLVKSRLTDFLEVVDSELEDTITLVAAGGTALTLLGLKPSTIDVDFTGPAKSLSKLKVVLDRLRPGFRVDYWADGMVFSQLLPGDYLQKSIPIRTGFKHIQLRALQSLDIVVTKIGRLDERDWQDIGQCINKFGPRATRSNAEQHKSSTQATKRSIEAM